MAQYVYTSESGSRLISDHGSDVLNSQSDERQFKPRVYNSIKIEEFVYESWPPLLRYGGGASVDYYDSPITSIVCSGGVCIYSYEAGNKSETVGQHGASTLSFLGARRISSFQTNIGSRTEIFKFIGASESRSYIYHPEIVEGYSELDFGLITANAGSTKDNGLISQLNGVTLEDRGHILKGWQRRFGFVRKIGEAQAKATNAWIGSGRIRKFGRQVSPAVWGAIADGKVRIFGSADAKFTTIKLGGGFTPLSGTAIIGIGIGVIGDGSLRKFSGAAESATWNPDEKQMLFSFTGGLTSEKHTESWVGSGRLRNFAKLEAEKGTFDYQGSGSIKLRPRKPVTYELSELANFTLETVQGLLQEHESFGDNTLNWNGTTQLGAVKLKDLREKDHEKHTEVYSQTAFVPYSEVDYGLLVNTNLINCNAVSGIISTNTTATTGCTKVAPGTTLAIAPGNTYTIPSQITTPTNSIDYGDVANPNAPQQIDHGWILGERSDLRTPYGLFKFVSHTGVYTTKQYHFTSDGTPPIFKILGKTALPLDVSVDGSGNLFTMGGAAETTAVALDGTGLFRFLSLSTTTRARDFVGSGRIPVFKGAAESLTFNPTEEQILFSVAGVGTEKHTEVFVGSGRLHSLSGSAEAIRWSAQHTTGLYRISGESYDLRSRAFAGSGSLRKFSGAAESLTFNPLERQMLFSFTGGITSEKHTEVYVGSGRIRNLATLEAEKGSFDYVGSGTFKLNPRKPQTYELGELGSFTLDFYSLRNAYINLGNLDFYSQYTNLGAAQLKWLNLEEGHEKHTEAYNNSACFDDPALDYGDLVNQNLTNCVANSGVINTNTTATSGCIKVAPGTTLAIAPGNTYTIQSIVNQATDFEDYGLVADASAPERRDYGWILGTLSKVCPYGAFEITGTAKTHFVENIVSTGYSVTGKAGVSIFGAGATFWTPPYFGRVLTRFSGTVGESFTPWIPPGDGILWSTGGSAECIANVEKADGLFKIGSQAYTLFSLLHPGSGTVRVIGSGAESITPATHVGSGSLKKFSGAAESATWNPLERQMLFSFTGTGSETFTANPPEEGTQVRISGDAFPVFFVPKYPGSGLIRVTGDSTSKTTKPFIGSGSLKKFSGAAESITFNPLEKQLLFSFIGSGTEAFVANPPEEGTNIRLRGEAVYKLDSSYIGSGRIVISGEAVSKTTKPFIGSGSLKKFSGAAESITFNPLERQLLFSFTGTGSENTVAVPPEGDGILFTFSGSTATSAAAFESTGLFRVGGVSVNVTSLSQVGSGSLRKISGAAESITFNPDEKQMLFSFTGESSSSLGTVEVGSGRIAIYPEAADYRFTPNWNSVGGVRIEIQSAYRFAPVWIGSGSLRKFSGAAESLTFNPEEKQMLFSFTGEGTQSATSREISKGGTLRLGNDARIVWVPNNIGSGTIFVSGNAKTHYVPDIEGSGRLYNFSGAAESQTIAITSIPSLFRVYGDGHVSRTRPYTGSGSLRKLGGSAESLTFNPDEKQMLFSFLGEGTSTRTRSESGQGTVKTLGESTSRFSPVFFGSGTTRLSGEVYVTRSRDFVGFGSLRKLSGAAESLTFNPEEKQMLFSFIGEGTQARTSKLLSQGGILTVRGTSGDPLLTFAEQPRVEIDITGDSYDLRAYGYAGSGRISNVNTLDESFTRDGYEGSGTISLYGIALVQVQLFQPPHTQVWII